PRGPRRRAADRRAGRGAARAASRGPRRGSRCGFDPARQAARAWAAPRSGPLAAGAPRLARADVHGGEVLSSRGRERVPRGVLARGGVRAGRGRAEQGGMYGHREAASGYRAALAPFIDAAEAVARAALDRELESRAARTRAELERRLDGLDKVLASAVNIDDA